MREWAGAGLGAALDNQHYLITTSRPFNSYPKTNTEPAFIQSQIFSKYETPQATEAKERALPLYAHCFFKPRDQQRSMANADPPSLTSAAVVHALTARRPKARYLVSHIDGFPLVLFRWLVWSMSDRVKDAFIYIQMLKERNFLKAVK